MFRHAKSDAGISRLELVILAALCVVIPALALPGLRGSRLSANERAAENNLLSLAAAEAAWKAEARVDQDADAVGEYGLLGELAGELVPRSGEKKPPAFMSPDFSTGGSAGTDGGCVVNGYVYRVYLAASVAESGEITAGDDKTLGGARDAAGKTLTDADAIKRQEEKLILYAWPEKAGSTGRWGYAVTEGRRLVGTDMASRPYSGRGPIGSPNVPAPDAAFLGKAFESDLAADAVGSDGNRWRLITAPQP